MTSRLTAVDRLGYGIGDFGINLYFISAMTYLLYFYTDVFGLSAAAASVPTHAGHEDPVDGAPAAGANRTGASPSSIQPFTIWIFASGALAGSNSSAPRPTCWTACSHDRRRSRPRN